MAPLASVGEQRGAHARERLARLLFQRGEQWYNFQGLRFYKEKFDPEWVPRYMAYQNAWEWPVAIAYVSALDRRRLGPRAAAGARALAGTTAAAGAAPLIAPRIRPPVNRTEATVVSLPTSAGQRPKVNGSPSPSHSENRSQ